MNPKIKFEDEEQRAALWIPVGMAIGVAIGGVLDDTAFGVAIGLIGGSAITLGIELKQKKRGPLLLGVALVALVWIVSLRVADTL